MSSTPFVQEKQITNCTSYLAHFFSSMVAMVQMTLRREFCLHYGTSLPPGSRNNVLTHNRVADFCEHHISWE